MKMSGFFKNIYVRNLLVAVLVFFVLLTVVLIWLSVYTHHGESVEVPNVKGLQVEAAAPFFANQNLQYQVVDSIYDKRAVPGSIIETVPPVGTKVKEGRTVYITTNSYVASLITIPEIKDLSQRQALAMLKSLGFENVNVRTVPGPYRDLVIGLESRGQAVEAGTHTSAGISLTLLVASGSSEYQYDLAEDSTVVLDELSPEETWY
jgi:beta-lactam-binding protein with PASTA domain